MLLPHSSIIFSGNDVTIPFAIHTPTGAYDTQDAVCVLTIKVRDTYSEALIIKRTDTIGEGIVDDHGVGAFYIKATDTASWKKGTYVFDITVEGISKVLTVCKGQVECVRPCYG